MRAIRQIVSAILAWDKQDVRHLNELLTELEQACALVGEDSTDYLDFSDLPSVAFEAGTEEWAMDINGNKLIGQCVPFDICTRGEE